MKKTVYVLGALSATALIACAAPSMEAAPSANFDNFTIEGKPTKTVKTPWGDKQVYDPSSDPEIIAAFKYVKRSHKRLGHEKANLESHWKLFERIRGIQYNDMARTGCLNIRRPTCGGEYLDFTVNTIRENCPTPAFGKAELDSCETNYTKLENNNGYPVQASAPPPQCYTNNFGYIGSKERDASLRGNADSPENYFESGCLSYEETVTIYE